MNWENLFWILFTLATYFLGYFYGYHAGRRSHRKHDV